MIKKRRRINLWQNLKQISLANYAAFMAIFFMVISPNNILAKENTDNLQTISAKTQLNPKLIFSRTVPTTSATRIHALSGEEKEMLIVINQERMEAGLPKLQLDLNLVKLAREKSEDMAFYNYFGHISKRLGSIYQQLDREKISYHFAGENLIGAPDCRKAMKSVLASPSHRGNILNPHFKKIGIGIVRGGPYGKMITQIMTG